MKALEEEVKRLQGEVERLELDLEKALLGEATIEKIMIENGLMSVEVGTKVAMVIASCLLKTLDGMGVENYVEMLCRTHSGEGVLLTVQREFHPSPHEFRLKAEEKLKSVLAELEELKK